MGASDCWFYSHFVGQLLMITKQGRESWYHFVSSASVIKPIFVPVKVLMTSHGTEMLSPYQGGQSLRACAGLWAVGCLETLPDMLRYEVFNSIGKKKKKKSCQEPGDFK